MIEEDEGNAQLKAVDTLQKELAQGILRGIPLGVTHGRQPSDEKARILAAFSGGKLAVLIATTVIEVGMNVPNATIMIVEDAQRYGLAQLHQLRGRVGRGAEESHCFLVGEENERLRALTHTNDGLKSPQGSGTARPRRASGYAAAWRRTMGGRHEHDEHPAFA